MRAIRVATMTAVFAVATVVTVVLPSTPALAAGGIQCQKVIEKVNNHYPPVEKVCAYTHSEMGLGYRAEAAWCYTYCDADRIDIRYVKLWQRHGDGGKTTWSQNEIFGCVGTDCHNYRDASTNGSVFTPWHLYYCGMCVTYAHSEVKFRILWKDGTYSPYYDLNSDDVPV
jgi:hypothetical protein